MAVEDTAAINGDLVNMTRQSLHQGTFGIQNAKAGLKLLIEPEERNGQILYPWQFFRIVDSSGVIILDATTNPHTSFREFVESPPLKGLGEKMEDIARLLNDDIEALAQLRALTVGGKGNPTGNNQYGNADITHISTDLFAEPEPAKKKANAGNSRSYTAARLKNERPDLFERVKNKELSAHKAAIEAGWRKAGTALECLQRTWKKASTEDRQAFLAWMSNDS